MSQFGTSDGGWGEYPKDVRLDGRTGDAWREGYRRGFADGRADVLKEEDELGPVNLNDVEPDQVRLPGYLTKGGEDNG